MTGVGDIAPQTGDDGGWRMERSLTGVLFGLIAMIIVAVRFAAVEFRRDQVRVLAARAIVTGAVTFVVGLAAVVVTVLLCGPILLSNGIQTLPATLFTELRVIVGTAALIAAAAVFALALAVLFRRRVPAAIVSFALVVLPLILTFTNVITVDMSQWLLRLTPAAGFAIQQSIPEYPYVIGPYIPQSGYYPLAPSAGLAVLCGYSVLALGLAIVKLRGRDENRQELI